MTMRHEAPFMTPRPIFVTGPYRSGTSVLTWALGQHPNVWPLAETGWLTLYGTGAVAGFDVAARAPQNYFALSDFSREEYLERVARSIDGLVKETSLRRASALDAFPDRAPEDEYFRLRRSLNDPKQRWVDGTPENTGSMLLLHWIFPEAKFVLLVRDPFDTVASMVHFDRAGGTAMSPRDAIRTWMRMTERGLLFYRAFGPGVVKIFGHAQLAADPAKTLAEMFAFVGEPHCPESELTMRRRVNTSNVTSEERARVRGVVRRLAGRKLSQRFEDIFAVAAAPWVADEAALRELERIQELPTSTLQQPQFAFVRWAGRSILRRLLGT